MKISSNPLILSGARWFWWIAGLSLINTIAGISNTNVNFVMGLSMVTLANMAFASNLALVLAVSGGLIAFYFFMGWYAQREKLWGCYLGLAVYAVDTALCLFLKDWFSAAFHAWALWAIFRATQPLRQKQSNAA